MNFQNKVAIITGGGTGIGKATAQALINEGAKVVINGRREDVLQATALEIDPSGRNVATLAGDISNSSTSAQLVQNAREHFGGVDILINNAGVFRPTPFLEHSESDFEYFTNIILRGTFFASQAVIPELRKRGGGAIVNTGSLWALQAVGATPSSAYSAAMAGRHALTRNLALEFAADNIRVNAVAPAVVETPVYGTFLSPEQVKEILPSFNGFHPLGRIGQPSDVVEAILFLARAAWITGVVLPVDGGVMAGRN
jgi:NAD(P)-dependent dehydrogenase (short-subunit alcohol dehydrogenase family)